MRSFSFGWGGTCLTGIAHCYTPSLRTFFGAILYENCETNDSSCKEKEDPRYVGFITPELHFSF